MPSMPNTSSLIVPTSAFRRWDRRARTLLALTTWALSLWIVGVAHASTRIDVLSTEAGYVVTMSGLPEETLSLLSDEAASRELLPTLFRVYVGRHSTNDQPAMLGRHHIADGRIVFEPRFPLRPGVAYRVVFDPTRLPPRSRTPTTAKAPLVHTFQLPQPEEKNPTTVRAVYPSSDWLPENQLKFYVHFTAAMSQGDSYRHVRLLDDQGKEIDLPFVNVGQELWDRSGQRITLLLDPGRIKRGLKPREELGPILREGGTYTLVVDRQWPDARGMPLASSFRKSFRVGPPDDVQPNPSFWSVTSPGRGTRNTVRIDFSEPLDHAMLMRVLRVVDGRGELVAGRVTVSDQEKRWSYVPHSDWKAGEYRIIVDTTLEDLAGNNIRRPFEVDMFREIQSEIPTSTVDVPFRVR